MVALSLIFAFAGCGSLTEPAAREERSATAGISLFADEFREGARAVVRMCLADRCTTFQHVMQASGPMEEIETSAFASVRVGLTEPAEVGGAAGQLHVTLVLRGADAVDATTKPTALKVEARVDGTRVIRGFAREVVFQRGDDCDCWSIDEFVP